MKRITYFLLAAVLLATALLPSCAEEAPLTTIDEGLTETANTEEDPLATKLTVAQVEAFPVANEEMSKDELRKLAIDFFNLQLSFRWVPDSDVLDYPCTHLDEIGSKTIETDTIYGGIPYQSLGTGNLYRWLEYYDEETGVFSFTDAFAENGGYGEGAAVTNVKKDDEGNVTYKRYRSMMVLFNQCSVSSFWGWARVINSANFVWTADMNVYNGFIPVGGFTYGYEHEGKYYGPTEIQRWGVKDEAYNPTGYDTVHAIRDWKKAQNDDEAMYKCYAQLKPGDCVVSSGHAMMVKSVEFFKREDGTINYALSSITAIEQIEGWGKKGVLHYNGEKIAFKNQGGVDRIYSFGELQTKKYLPFTFAEYLDPQIPEEKTLLDTFYANAQIANPVAKRYTNFQFTEEQVNAMSGAGIEPSQVFVSFDTSAPSLSYKEFADSKIACNYVISDLFVRVKDKDGNELVKNIYRSTSAQIREVSAKSRKSTWEYDSAGNAITVSDGVKELANGENTLEITIQISTGELLTVYSGTLTA